MFATIISWFLGSGLSTITGEIGKWQERKLNAQTSGEKLDADIEIESLRAKRDILIADSNGSWMRTLIALPFVGYLWTVVFYDKVLCKFGNWACSTDPLGTDLWALMMLVVGGYFVDKTVRRVFGR